MRDGSDLVRGSRCQRRGQGRRWGEAAAVGVDAVDLEVGADGVLHAGDEQVLAVRGPRGEIVAAGVEGEAPGNAAGGGDGVDVGIAAVHAGDIGDGLAVGREEWAVAYVAGGGEASGAAAFAGDDPDIVSVAECDLGVRDGRRAEEMRSLREGRGGGEKGDKEEGREAKADSPAHRTSWVKE